MTIDIDPSQAINDTQGHPVGDLDIRGLAWLFTGKLRAKALIGRDSGEELLYASPGAVADGQAVRPTAFLTRTRVGSLVYLSPAAAWRRVVAAPYPAVEAVMPRRVSCVLWCFVMSRYQSEY